MENALDPVAPQRTDLWLIRGGAHGVISRRPTDMNGNMVLMFGQFVAAVLGLAAVAVGSVCQLSYCTPIRDIGRTVLLLFSVPGTRCISGRERGNP